MKSVIESKTIVKRLVSRDFWKEQVSEYKAMPPILRGAARKRFISFSIACLAVLATLFYVVLAETFVLAAIFAILSIVSPTLLYCQFRNNKIVIAFVRCSDTSFNQMSNLKILKPKVQSATFEILKTSVNEYSGISFEIKNCRIGEYTKDLLYEIVLYNRKDIFRIPYVIESRSVSKEPSWGVIGDYSSENICESGEEQ